MMEMGPTRTVYDGCPKIEATKNEFTHDYLDDSLSDYYYTLLLSNVQVIN